MKSIYRPSTYYSPELRPTPIIDRIFGHKHQYVQIGEMWRQGTRLPNDLIKLCMPVPVVRVMKCRCGDIYKKLTSAGEQQVYHWQNPYEEVMGELII